MARSARLGASALILLVACGADGRVDEVADAIASDAAEDVGVDDSGDAMLFAAAGCGDGCRLVHAARLDLPSLGRHDIRHAKVMAKDGTVREVAIDGQGHAVDARELIEAERAARFKKYGRKTPDLAAWLAKAEPADKKWVWILTRTPPPAPRKLGLGKVEVQVPAEVTAVRARLEKTNPGLSIGDSSGPMLRALLTPDEVRALESDPAVGLLGTDEYPGRPHGTPWGSISQWGATIGLPAAHAGVTSPGSGARVCVKEDKRPTDVTSLPIALVANPSGPSDVHPRLTAGIIANTLATSAPWQSVAPSASLYIANTSGYSGAGGVDAWCASNSVRTWSYSQSVLGGGGGPGGTDIAHDWLAKNYPYALVVASAGDIDTNNPTSGHVVRNRGFNGLVVGAAYDSNTADPSDDHWSSTSAWGNSTTPHSDYELPHLAAPDEPDVFGTRLSGTSGPTAMVAGTSALLSSTDGSFFDSWPEAKRAVILATATRRADQGTFTSLTATPGDKKIGVGILDTASAVDLANPANLAGNNAVLEKGRLARSVQLSGADWDASSFLNTRWKATAPANGRIRVVIAWDSTTNCSGAGTGTCTTDTPDADLDLMLFDRPTGWDTSGSAVCTSGTFDSTYEVCDIPVTAGQTFLIAIKKYGTAAASTYLGVAWKFYRLPSGSTCTAGTECQSGTCSSGQCACSVDSDCPDRFCNSGVCTSRFYLGGVCGRGAQCLSGNCTDYVCCDSACSGTCQACTAAKKGSGYDGNCGFIGAGLNPDGDCSASTCVAGSYTSPSTCNGAGACTAPSNSNCAPYVCASSTTCATTCTSDAGCVGNSWCNGSSCAPKKSLTEVCTGGNQCQSGQCQSGVCCSAAIDDGNACTVDSCSTATGQPIHTRTATIASCAPLWGTPTLAATQSGGASLQLTWSAAAHGLGVADYRIYRDGAVIATTTSTSWTGAVALGTATFSVQARVSSGGTTTESNDGPSAIVTMSAPAAPLSPPPATTFDPSVPTSFADQTGFLFTGAGAPQQPLAPYSSISIDPKTQAVVRGVIVNLAGNPIGGATVTIAGRPELGFTITRADGTYDMAVPGGGRLVVQINHGGHIPVQRVAEPSWHEILNLPLVALTPYSPIVTTVANNAAAWQTVRSATENDCVGKPTSCARQATLLIPPGTIVTRASDGAVYSQLHVRATELTVVGNNVSALTAMPGDLPPTSAFTYAIAFDADEAIPSGAKVKFSKDIAVYVPNFVGFPVGATAPLGYYDRDRAAWVPERTGRVVKIVDIVDGKAVLDPSAASLGITDDAELRQLVADGDGDGVPDHKKDDQLWRVVINHFSDWDVNQGVVPPPGARFPNGRGQPPPGCNTPKKGSIIHCESQALGESFPIAGTSNALNYWSHRAEVRAADRGTAVELWADSPPPAVKRIHASLSVAGKTFVKTFVPPASVSAPPLPRFAYFTEWDGTDVYGRRLEGDQKARVSVTYVYGAAYGAASVFGYSVRESDRSIYVRGGTLPNGTLCPTITEYYSGGVAGVKSKSSCPDDIHMVQRSEFVLATSSVKGSGLGRWDFDKHHAYNPESGTLYRGDGTVVRAKAFSNYWASLDRTVVHADTLVTALPNGGMAYFDWLPSGGGYGLFLRVSDASGATVSVGSPIDSQPLYATLSPDAKSLYVITVPPSAPAHVHAIERIDLTTGGRVRVAGGTSAGFTAATCGTTCLAKDYAIREATALAFGKDGSLFVAHEGDVSSSNELLQISPPADSTDLQNGRPHVHTSLAGRVIKAMVVGQDGHPIVATTSGSTLTKITRLLPGDVSVDIAGSTPTDTASVGLATFQKFSAIEMRSIGDGAIAIVTREDAEVSPRLRLLTPDGLLRVVMGTGESAPFAPGPAPKVTLGSGHTRYALTSWPNGELAIVSIYDIVRVKPSAEAMVAGDLTVLDGGYTHIFSSSGRHKATYNSHTQTKVAEFTYDSLNRLKSVIDPAGKITTIFRAGEAAPSGTVSANKILIVAPYGQTTELTLDSAGDLIGLADPSGYAWSLVWMSGKPGLLSQLSEPNGTHNFSWLSSSDDPRFDGMLKRDWLMTGSTLVYDQTLSRVLDEATGKVTVSVKDGTDMTDTIEVLPGGEARTDTSKTGVVRTAQQGLDGTTTVAAANGWQSVTTVSADAVLGMSSPLSSTKRTATTSYGEIEVTKTHTAVATPTGATVSTMLTRTDTTTTTGKVTSPTTVTTATAPTRTTLLERNTPASGKTRLTETYGSIATVTVLQNDLVLTVGHSTYAPLMDGSDVLVPMLHGTSFTYDAGRLSSVTRGTRTVGFTYKTTSGLLDVMTDSLTRTWQYTEYDAAGRVKKLVMPGAGTLQVDYDSAKRLSSITPPGRPAHTFEFGSDDLLRKYWAAGDSLSVGYEWDAAGRPTKVTRQDLSSVTITPDTLKRPSTVVDSRRSSTDTYTYESAGAKRLKKIASSSPSVDLEYFYDGPTLGKVVWTTSELVSDVSYTFDGLVRRATVTTSKGGFESYTTALRYNGLGLLGSTGAPSTVDTAPIMTLNYHSATGLLTGITVGSTTEKLAYNAYGELARQTIKLGATPLYEAKFEGSGFVRDAAGRILRKDETISGALGHSYVYEYDTAGRLAKVFLDGASVASEEYTYGTNGVRLTTKRPGPCAPGCSAVYEDHDRLSSFAGTTYAYRASGERSSKTASGATTTYDYDGRGALVRVTHPDTTVVEYVLDGRGRRIGKKVGGILKRSWIYDGQLRIVGEVDAASGALTHFVYGTNPITPNYLVRGGTVYRVVSDHLGSVRLVVDAATGTIKQRMTYDAFGSVLEDYIESGWLPIPQAYAGGLYDRDGVERGSGLLHLGAREYDAGIGLWLTPDPSRFEGGPNHYAYCGGEPINLVDLDGTQATVALPWGGARPGPGAGAAAAAAVRAALAAAERAAAAVAAGPALPASVALSFPSDVAVSYATPADLVDPFLGGMCAVSDDDAASDSEDEPDCKKIKAECHEECIDAYPGPFPYGEGYPACCYGHPDCTEHPGLSKACGKYSGTTKTFSPTGADGIGPCKRGCIEERSGGKC